MCYTGGICVILVYTVLYCLYGVILLYAVLHLAHTLHQCCVLPGRRWLASAHRPCTHSSVSVRIVLNHSAQTRSVHWIASQWLGTDKRGLAPVELLGGLTSGPVRLSLPVCSIIDAPVPPVGLLPCFGCFHYATVHGFSLRFAVRIFHRSDVIMSTLFCIRIWWWWWWWWWNNINNYMVPYLFHKRFTVMQFCCMCDKLCAHPMIR